MKGMEKNDTAKQAHTSSAASRAKAAAIVSAVALTAALAVPTLAFAQEEGRTGPCMRACFAAACQGFSDMGSCGRNACCSLSDCAGFVDADADGTCDNFAGIAYRGAGAGCRFVDADADGVCDRCGRDEAACPADADADGICDGFVDADADGVCDNAGNGGTGAGYVDADNDGVCDNAGGRGFGHAGNHGCGRGFDGHGCRGGAAA